MWYSFENWLTKTVRTFGLEALLTEKLTERVGLFDPQEILERATTSSSDRKRAKLPHGERFSQAHQSARESFTG